MVTKRDVENMQEELKAAIMREDWKTCDVLVKQIGEASERLRQPTKRAADEREDKQQTLEPANGVVQYRQGVK